MKKFLTVSLVAIYLLAWLPVASPALALEPPQGGCGSGATPACLYYSPASGNVSVTNSQFTVEVWFSTGGQNSMGADVWAKFDPTQVSFVSGTYPDGNDSGGHPIFPMKVIEPIVADSTGVIKMTRLINLSTNPVYTNGTGKFATLTFNTLNRPMGSSVNLSFMYTQGMGGGDSSVAGTIPGVDILGAATPATLILAAGGGGQPTGVLDHVDLVPTSATLAPNGTQSFTATAKDSTGATISTGVTYAWAETGDGAVNPSTGATTTYTAGPNTGTGTVTVTATQGTVTKTATANITISTSGGFIPGGSTSGPVINSISPNSGSKDATPQVTINGFNFGSFDTAKSKVYFGMNEATVMDWSNSRIVVRAPASPDITARLTVTVRVLTSDDKTAEYLGYTYTMLKVSGGSLPDNGPETYTWIGLLMAAFGMAGLAYLKLANKKTGSNQPTQIG